MTQAVNFQFKNKSARVFPVGVADLVAAAAVVVAAVVVVAVANNENDYQKNYPSTVAVVECVTHKMCLLIMVYLNAFHLYRNL